MDSPHDSSFESELFAQTKILELIALGKPQVEVFPLLLSSIEALVPGIIGSILLLDESGKRLKHGCSTHLPPDFCRAIDGSEIGPEAGSCGTAAYLGKRIVVECIETDPLWRNYKHLALNHGLKACWSQPIFSSDRKVLGTFAMYYKAPRKPGFDELRILDTAAHLVAVCIERERMEANLKQTLIDLENSNRELEQFVYIVSHDLQEPLRIMTTHLQYVERLSKEKLSDPEKQSIHFAIEAAIRMKTMMQDLLKYAHSWKDPQNFKSVCLQDVVEAALSNLKVVISENRATFSILKMPTLRIEPQQMVQVFQNLIGNAIKYRRECPPKIEIKAVEKSSEWLFSVRDNGIGLKPEYAEKIFIAFQRLHSYWDKYPGTGIGLTICKKILERHGGRIWVESIPNEGSCFFFTLPKTI